MIMPTYTQLNWLKIPEKLGWKKLLQLHYLAPSDYHLLRGLQNHLDGLRLTSRERLEHKLISYFVSKHNEFYKCGIYKLFDEWNEV